MKYMIVINIIRLVNPKWIQFAGSVPRMRELRDAHRTLVGKPENFDVDAGIF
jgi:hypothetical protein